MRSHRDAPAGPTRQTGCCLYRRAAWLLGLTVAAGAGNAGAQESPTAAPPLNLSLPGMWHDTDALVRTVLLLLLLASLLTWTIWVAKGLELLRAKRLLQRDVQRLLQAHALEPLPPLASHAARHLTDAVRQELGRSGDVHQPLAVEGLKERVSVRLLSGEAMLARRMQAGIGIVASIGATAPFVGLLGTVWGVMTSFLGIAHSQAANLAAVAPGIAEALLTTAAGLAAAIPAVLIYNGFTGSLAGYRGLLADTSHAIACALSLQLERALAAPAHTPAVEELIDAV